MGWTAPTGQVFRQVLISSLKAEMSTIQDEIENDGAVFAEGEVRARLEFYYLFDSATAGDLPHGVSTDPPRAYEVFACTRCDGATTTVHGLPSSLSYCPACRQRALELRTGRRSDGRVEVREACPICGYHGVAVVPEVVEDLPTTGEGKVLPFRK